MLFDWYDYDRAFSSFDNVRRQFDRALADAAARPAAAAANVPAANVLETADELVVLVSVPGIERDALEIELVDNVLTITGERKLTTPEGFVARRRERAATQFRRTFSLPHPVDADRTRAELRDGWLTVRLARTEPPRPRQIAVVAG